MFRRQHYIAFSAVLVLGLILISLPDAASTRLKVAFSSLFLPLFGLADSSRAVMDRGRASLRPRKELAVELERLTRENEKLRLQIAQSAEILNENHRLRDEIGWQRRSGWNLKLARVIARDPANWRRTVRINLGIRDGIRENMAVRTSEGLVGRIFQVGLGTSQVALIGDPNCHVPAQIKASAALNEERGDSISVGFGIIKSGGTSVLDPTVVSLTFVDGRIDLRPGQIVVTSELSQIFPPGITIGQIAHVNRVGFGMNWEARVKLAADLSNLEEVFVIVQ